MYEYHLSFIILFIFVDISEVCLWYSSRHERTDVFFLVFFLTKIKISKKVHIIFCSFNFNLVVSYVSPSSAFALVLGCVFRCSVG